jgi:hypothetical protein
VENEVEPECKFREEGNLKWSNDNTSFVVDASMMRRR